MKQVLLDTNCYTGLLKGDEPVLNTIGEAERVYMSIFVLGELLFGFKGGTREIENRNLLKQFLSKPTVRILQATEETADYFSEIMYMLKKSGNKIPINDVWIAAHSMEYASVLLTYDLHFENVPGLRLWKT